MDFFSFYLVQIMGSGFLVPLAMDKSLGFVPFPTHFFPLFKGWLWPSNSFPAFTASKNQKKIKKWPIPPPFYCNTCRHLVAHLPLSDLQLHHLVFYFLGQLNTRVVACGMLFRTNTCHSRHVCHPLLSTPSVGYTWTTSCSMAVPNDDI